MPSSSDTSIVIRGCNRRAVWPVLAALAVIGVVLVVLRLHGAPTVWAAGGGALLLLAVRMRTHKQRDRYGVVVEADDVTLTDGAGRPIPIERIAGLSLVRSPAVAVGAERPLEHVGIWLQTDDESLECIQVWPRKRAGLGVIGSRPSHLDDDSPLLSWTAALVDRLDRRARDDLARGKSVTGRSWVLTRHELQLTGEADELVIPLKDLTAVETVAGAVCLWSRGDLRPVARIPEHFCNAWLLERLLIDHLAERTQPAGEAESADESGRLLFEHHPGLAPAAVAMISLGTMALVVSALLVITAFVLAALGMALLGGVIGVAGLLSTSLGVRHYRSRLICYERAVECVDAFGRRLIPFDRVAEMQYREEVERLRGIRLGVVRTLVLVAEPELKVQGIAFRAAGRRGMAEVLELRARVAERIALRMARRLAEAGNVGWTPELRIHTNGLRFIPRGILGSPQHPVWIPWDAITLYQAVEGWFYVWTNWQERAVVKVRTSATNFDPGLILFSHLADLTAETASMPTDAAVEVG